MKSNTYGPFNRGIDRARPGASAKAGTFWDLVNCFVTPSGTIRKRPGFTHIGRLNAATKGLFANGGALRTFYSAGNLTAPAWSVNLVYHALRMPPDADGVSAAVAKVYADYLFIGKQYVAAKFDDDVIRHYWLQDPAAWKSSSFYDVDQLVQPSTPNGYYYAAEADHPPPAWQPNVAYAVGDSVQPTTYNGYKYTVTATAGASPRSGTLEPNWITGDGALVQEYVNESGTTGEAPPVPSPDTGYDNYPGAGE